MIQLFDRSIRGQFAGRLAESDLPLRYLKFSTVTSGSKPDDKVIFLVFKKGAVAPFLCVKTVRSYGSKGSVLRNFNNLKRLNELVAGTPYASLFAEAIHLYDDGENVFSIETACSGVKAKLDKKRLDAVVEAYSSFQEHAAEREKSAPRDMRQLVTEIAGKSGLADTARQELLAYALQLVHAGIRLPRIIQHGDLTPDNLLFGESGPCIIDYDYTGYSDIPGFDLFGLFRRFNRAGVRKLCEEYLPAYFERVGGTVDQGSYRALLFLYYLTWHAQKGTLDPDQVIAGFESSYTE